MDDLDSAGFRSVLDALSEALRERRSQLLWVHGPPGVGKSSLVARALRGRQVEWLDCGGRSDAALRNEVAGRLERLEDRDRSGAGGGEPGQWQDLWRRVADLPSGPRIWVLDDAPDLIASGRPRDAAGEFWNRLRSSPNPRLLILVGRGRGWVDRLREQASPFHDPRQPLVRPPGHDPRPGRVVQVPALDLREARGLLPGEQPADQLRAYAVFGGKPSTLAVLEPSRGLLWNVREALLDPDGPLFSEPLGVLRHSVQAPGRYLEVLAALAEGSRGWGAIARSGESFTSSASVAPYVSRLEEEEWVEALRPLDALAQGRRRRYRVADPFHEFWAGEVLPRRSLLRVSGPGAWEERAVLQAVERAAARNLPRMAEPFLLRGAEAALGAVAREVGGLWGDGYDLPLAGTLRNGVAFYGDCRWSGTPVGLPELERVEHAIRETRYGFGRERRIRLLVAGSGFEDELLRRSRGREEIVLVHAERLAGPD